MCHIETILFCLRGEKMLSDCDSVVSPVVLVPRHLALRRLDVMAVLIRIQGMGGVPHTSIFVARVRSSQSISMMQRIQLRVTKDSRMIATEDGRRISHSDHRPCRKVALFPTGDCSPQDTSECCSSRRQCSAS